MRELIWLAPWLDKRCQGVDNVVHIGQGAPHLSQACVSHELPLPHEDLDLPP